MVVKEKCKLITSGIEANSEPNHQKNPMAMISPTNLFTPEKSATEQIPMTIRAINPIKSPIILFY